MHKDSLILLGVLITVVSVVAGVLGHQIDLVQGELQNNRQSVYSIPAIKDDISEIKVTLKEIQISINEINLKP